MSRYSLFLKVLFVFLVFPLQSFSESDDGGGDEGDESCGEMLAPIFSSFAGELKDVAINKYGPLCKNDAEKEGKEGLKSENCKVLECLKKSDIGAFPGVKKSKGMIEGIDDMMSSSSNPFPNKIEDSPYEPLAAGEGASQAVRKDGLSQGTIDKIDSQFKQYGFTKNNLSENEAREYLEATRRAKEYYLQRGVIPPKEVQELSARANTLVQFSQNVPTTASAPPASSASASQHPSLWIEDPVARRQYCSRTRRLASENMRWAINCE